MTRFHSYRVESTVKRIALWSLVKFSVVNGNALGSYGFRCAVARAAASFTWSKSGRLVFAGG